MGWFSRNTSTNIPSNQVEQRSHQLLNMSSAVTPDSSDISHTLDQLSQNQTPLQIKELQNATNKANNQSVSDFVGNRPKNLYIIDGEKEIEESIICTNNEQGGKTCLKLRYNSVELFKQMQRLDYFCSLPDDINATYFECRKIT